MCFFWGFSVGTKGYKVYDLEAKQYILSRDVIFYEEKFPYVNQDEHQTQDTEEVSGLECIENYDSQDLNFCPQKNKEYGDQSPTTQDPTQEELSIENVPAPTNTFSPSPEEDLPTLRRSSRESKPPSYLESYDCPTLQGKSAPKLTSPHEVSNVVTYDRLTSKHHAFSISISSCTEPRTYQEASKYSYWKNAMEAELKALEENNT